VISSSPAFSHRRQSSSLPQAVRCERIDRSGRLRSEPGRRIPSARGRPEPANRTANGGVVILATARLHDAPICAQQADFDGPDGVTFAAKKSAITPASMSPTSSLLSWSLAAGSATPWLAGSRHLAFGFGPIVGVQLDSADCRTKNRLEAAHVGEASGVRCADVHGQCGPHSVGPARRIPSARAPGRAQQSAAGVLRGFRWAGAVSD